VKRHSRRGSTPGRRGRAHGSTTAECPRAASATSDERARRGDAVGRRADAGRTAHEAAAGPC
jgi:hypothetical protein